MNQENIVKYLAGRMSEAERVTFYDALKEDRVLKKEFIRQKNLWAVSASLGEEKDEHNTESDYFMYRLDNKKEEHGKTRRLYVKLNTYKVAAVVMLALLLGSVVYMLHKSQPESNSEMLYTETYVPKGEKSEITLPDGTRVIINADTRLKFPTNFNMNNRRLKIKGEAYFDVVHNPNSPFLVETESINIEVLGTSFNLSCYPDDEMVTTMLEEGKVRFSGANNNRVNGTYLKPGETAYYHKASGIFKIKATDTELDLSSWKQGKLKFKDMPLHVLAHKIERLYNVDIEIDGSLKYERYTGEIDEMSVWEVMNSFAIATPFNVESNGRKIKVTPKKNYK